MSGEDVRMSRMEAAAESTFAKLLTRYGVPLLITVIGVFMRDAMSDLKADVGSLAEKQAETDKKVTSVQSDVRDLNTRVDLALINQMDDLKRRVETLEQQVRTQ